MPAFTPNLNLYKPGGGSSGSILPDEVVDIDRINQNMDILDGAVKGLQDRAGLLESQAGLTLLKPTSVSNSKLTIQPNGTVTGTNVTAGRVNIDGVFPAPYEHFRIIGYIKKPTINATMAAIPIRNGSDISDTYYRSQQVIGSGGRNDVTASTGADMATVMDDAGSRVFFVTDVYTDTEVAFFMTSFMGRGGTVSLGQKSGSTEALGGSRMTGIGIDTGQTLSKFTMKFFAVN